MPPNEHSVVSGVTPSSSSAEAVITLNVDAAGKIAFVGSPRIDGSASECSAIASTRPVDGSIATIAAYGVW